MIYEPLNQFLNQKTYQNNFANSQLSYVEYHLEKDIFCRNTQVKDGTNM